MKIQNALTNSMPAKPVASDCVNSSGKNSFGDLYINLKNTSSLNKADQITGEPSKISTSRPNLENSITQSTQVNAKYAMATPDIASKQKTGENPELVQEKSEIIAQNLTSDLRPEKFTALTSYPSRTNQVIEQYNDRSSTQENNDHHVNWLTENPDRQDKPAVGDFKRATGVDSDTAIELLYNVVGANKDLRNWKAIMASADPLTNAGLATGQLYNSNLDYAADDIPASHTISGHNVIKKSGNFALLETVNEGTDMWLISKAGLLLTGVDSAERAKELALRYGFNYNDYLDIADEDSSNDTA